MKCVQCRRCMPASEARAGYASVFKSSIFAKDCQHGPFCGKCRQGLEQEVLPTCTCRALITNWHVTHDKHDVCGVVRVESTDDSCKDVPEIGVGGGGKDQVSDKVTKPVARKSQASDIRAKPGHGKGLAGGHSRGKDDANYVETTAGHIQRAEATKAKRNGKGSSEKNRRMKDEQGKKAIAFDHTAWTWEAATISANVPKERLQNSTSAATVVSGKIMHAKDWGNQKSRGRGGEQSLGKGASGKFQAGGRRCGMAQRGDREFATYKGGGKGATPTKGKASVGVAFGAKDGKGKYLEASQGKSARRPWSKGNGKSGKAMYKARGSGTEWIDVCKDVDGGKGTMSGSKGKFAKGMWQ